MHDQRSGHLQWLFFFFSANFELFGLGASGRLRRWQEHEWSISLVWPSVLGLGAWSTSDDWRFAVQFCLVADQTDPTQSDTWQQEGLRVGSSALAMAKSMAQSLNGQKEATYSSEIFVSIYFSETNYNTSRGLLVKKGLK